MERYLIEQESVGLFLAYFLAFWNAWKVGGNYGLKYNNVDLTHKLFWTGYGLCVVGMLQHTAGGVNGSNAQGFAVSSAMLHVLLGLQVCVQCSSLSLTLPTVAVATVDPSAMYSSQLQRLNSSSRGLSSSLVMEGERCLRHPSLNRALGTRRL